MHIEILSIGNELLTGRTLNTNATFICKQLHAAGYAVFSQTTLPDEKEPLKRALSEALLRSSFVIATGGLGPTLDDLTREVAADLFGRKHSFHPEVAKGIEKRGNEFAIQDQATLPEGALILPNLIGSAPGLILSDEKRTLILLPGVPQEMEALFLKEVLPYLRKKWPLEKRYEEQLHFGLIYESQLDPLLRALRPQFPAVEVGIYPAYGELMVVLSSLSKEPLLSFVGLLKGRFASYLFESPFGKIEEALLLSCTKRGKKLVCAESCTGGRIASLVTTPAGASVYFLGSLVTYSNELKHSLLGVSNSTLERKGAVSAETVREMVEGLFARTQADYALAVSGIAGPSGGSKEKPVGTIYVAIGQRGEAAEVGCLHLAGDRERIVATAAKMLLFVLWRKIEKGIPAFPLVNPSDFQL